MLDIDAGEVHMADDSSDSTFPPEHNGMPDLSALGSKALLSFILNRWFGQRGPTLGGLEHPFLFNLVRLTDKTIREYELARVALDEYLSTPGSHLSPIFRTVDHLENCIGALHRAWNLAERMRRARLAPRIDRVLMLPPADRARVRSLRVAIEHTDSLLSKGEIPPVGEPSTLYPGTESLRIGSTEVPYKDLAAWVSRLHALVKHLGSTDWPTTLGQDADLDHGTM